jgi:nucleoside-diphosphate-sugar epimerase
VATIDGVQYDGVNVTVLVTGASGFIGQHVIANLLRRSIRVRVAFREGAESMLPVDNLQVVYLSGPGTASEDWAHAVTNCSAVIHLAARAHFLRDRHEDPVRAFRLANVDYARACGEAAAVAGVKRFIFMSSLGVHGGTSSTEPIRAESPFRPHTLYACSKAEAERALEELIYGSNMRLTVIRPPLVYGAGARGNFGLLVKAAASGLPLPLGSIKDNRRSFVAIDNLVDLIVTCLNHHAAADQTFLVSDGEDISTTDLLRRLGSMMGRPARLMPVPVGCLEFGAKLLGKREIYESLCSSLQVDISKTCSLLDWKPPVSVNEGLRRAVQQRL